MGLVLKKQSAIYTDYLFDLYVSNVETISFYLLIGINHGKKSIKGGRKTGLVDSKAQ